MRDWIWAGTEEPNTASTISGALALYIDSKEGDTLIRLQREVKSEHSLRISDNSSFGSRCRRSCRASRGAPENGTDVSISCAIRMTGRYRTPRSKIVHVSRSRRLDLIQRYYTTPPRGAYTWLRFNFLALRDAWGCDSPASTGKRSQMWCNSPYFSRNKPH